MNKLTKQTQLTIKNAVEIASTLGVESIVMDEISLRGENKELGVAIILPMADVDVEFDSIGITRVALLKSRLQMLENPKITFQTLPSTEDELHVASLDFEQGRTKISFKCGDAKRIQAPKSINDAIFYEMQLNDEDVQVIIKGINSMASDVVNFGTEDENILIKISDSTGDMFTHQLEGTVTVLDDTAPALCKSYKAKTLRTIFTNYIRKDENTILPIAITRRGVMRISVLNMYIYLFPNR